MGQGKNLPSSAADHKPPPPPPKVKLKRPFEARGRSHRGSPERPAGTSLSRRTSALKKKDEKDLGVTGSQEMVREGSDRFVVVSLGKQRSRRHGNVTG